MEVIKAVPDGIRAVVFTVYGTLFHCEEYVNEGEGRIFEALGVPFSLPPERVREIVMQRMADLEGVKKRKVTFLETILTLSIADMQWQSICDGSYRPESFCQKEKKLRSLLKQQLGLLTPSFKLIAAGMMTRGLAARILGVLGLNGKSFFSGRIWSPEQGGNPVEEAYWRSLAVHFGFAPATIVVVGNSHVTDVAGPRAAGYGGIVLVEGPHELQKVISLLRRSRRGGE